jgi:MFS family permease
LRCRASGQALVEVFSVFAAGAALVVDRIGRRATLLTGVGVMIASNVLMLGLFTFTDLSGGAPSVLGLVGILFFLPVFQALGGGGTFALFLGLAIVSFAFIAAPAPETERRPL